MKKKNWSLLAHCCLVLGTRTKEINKIYLDWKEPRKRNRSVLFSPMFTCSWLCTCPFLLLRLMNSALSASAFCLCAGCTLWQYTFFPFPPIPVNCCYSGVLLTAHPDLLSSFDPLIIFLFVKLSSFTLPSQSPLLTSKECVVQDLIFELSTFHRRWSWLEESLACFQHSKWSLLLVFAF